MSKPMMKAAALDDLRRIWRITTVQRDKRTMAVLGWLALLGAGLGLIGSIAMILKHQAPPLAVLRVLCGAGACWLGFVWMMLFVPTSILLNSPANARLVPRQRRRLMQMAASWWLLVTAGVTAAIGQWEVFPLAGVTMMSFALMRSGRKEAAPLFIVGINWPSLSRYLLPPALVDALTSDTGVLVLSALLLPLGAWALRSVYPDGGDGHLARRGEQIRLSGWFNRQAWSDTGEGSPLRRWTSTWVYSRMLALALRRPRPGAMLMHALGPLAHWSAWLGGVAVMLLMGGGVLLLMAWRGRPLTRDFIEGAMNGALGTLPFFLALSTAAFSQQIRKNTGEQSLLRLTPLAGNAALLNRRLALALLKNGLRTWAVLTGLIVLAAFVVFGAKGQLLARVAALCLLGGQVAMMELLGDFALDGGWTVPRALQAALLALVELLVALGLDKLSGVSIWAWLALIAVGAGAVQLRRAWRGMLAAPPAFPAGRMS
jgi:hypothetical protein